MNESSCAYEIIQETLQAAGNSLSVSSLCSMAGVSRSGYYAWLKAGPIREAQEQKDREDFDLVLEAYRMRGYSKGAKGIYMALLHMEPPVIMNLKKIRRLMDKYSLSCPVRKANPYRRMARALKTNSVADNLLRREFECYGPRMVLLTDITYLPYNGTFAYLSTILDAFTKQILSYVLRPVIGSRLRPGNNRIAYRKTWNLAPCRNGHPQRPGMPLYKPQIHQYRAGQRAQAVHVTQGQLLGQCAAGKLLRPHEGSHKGQGRGLFLLWRCQGGRGRLHGLLQ